LVGCSGEKKKGDLLKQKIASMLIVGFRGDTPASAKHLAEKIKNKNLGGVILFNSDPLIKGSHRNIKSPKQLKTLTAWLQGLSPNQLFIAIDQEGGKVNRLQKKMGFPETLSAFESYKNSKLFHENNVVIAKTLKENGINLNFAPVVDLGVNPSNFIFLKERIFSDDPKLVVDAARGVIKAHHQYGIFTVLKHFPGHGSSEADSHKGFADVTNSWSKLELTPYLELKNETDMIMTSHIFNNDLDANYPATLSANILTDLLRNEIGYDGVIISDDLGMKAISDHYTLQKTVTLAINAGVDMLLFANTTKYDENIFDVVVNIIAKQVQSGAISLSRIDESYARIQKLRSKINKDTHNIPMN